MEIIRNQISIEKLREIAAGTFGNLIKAVVDIKKGIMAIDAELHSDQEAYLMTNENSKQKDLWGINLYPGLPAEEWIEFDSVINLRPANGNVSRRVDDPELREEIRTIVNRLAKR